MKFTNDNGATYEVIKAYFGESTWDNVALLKDKRQYIVAVGVPHDLKGSWGQGHYFLFWGDEGEALRQANKCFKKYI